MPTNFSSRIVGLLYKLFHQRFCDSGMIEMVQWIVRFSFKPFWINPLIPINPTFPCLSPAPIVPVHDCISIVLRWRWGVCMESKDFLMKIPLSYVKCQCQLHCFPELHRNLWTIICILLCSHIVIYPWVFGIYRIYTCALWTARNWKLMAFLTL